VDWSGIVDFSGFVESSGRLAAFRAARRPPP
jgi:hypothetical protein